MDEQVAFLIMGVNGRYVGSEFDEEAAFKVAKGAAEHYGQVFRVATVPVIAEFGPLSRLEEGEDGHRG